MFTIILTIVSLAVIVVNVWFNYVGWIYLGIINLFSIIATLHFKSQNEKASLVIEHSLSPGAEELIKKHWHFYSMPLATRDFASALAFHQFIGVVLCGFDIYNDRYWTISFAFINWYSLAYASHFFNPLLWIQKSGKSYLHEEVILFLETHDHGRRQSP